MPFKLFYLKEMSSDIYCSLSIASLKKRKHLMDLFWTNLSNAKRRALVNGACHRVSKSRTGVGLGMWLSWHGAWLACVKPWGPPPALYKAGLVVRACLLSVRVVEAGGSGTEAVLACRQLEAQAMSDSVSQERQQQKRVQLPKKLPLPEFPLIS